MTRMPRASNAVLAGAFVVGLLGAPVAADEPKPTQPVAPPAAASPDARLQTHCIETCSAHRPNAATCGVACSCARELLRHGLDADAWERKASETVKPDPADAKANQPLLELVARCEPGESSRY